MKDLILLSDYEGYVYIIHMNHGNIFGGGGGETLTNLGTCTIPGK